MADWLDVMTECSGLTRPHRGAVIAHSNINVLSEQQRQEQYQLTVPLVSQNISHHLCTRVAAFEQARERWSITAGRERHARLKPRALYTPGVPPQSSSLCAAQEVLTLFLKNPQAKNAVEHSRGNDPPGLPSKFSKGLQALADLRPRQRPSTSKWTRHPSPKD